MNQHRDSPMCLCGECVARQRTLKEKGQNPDFPDCSSCHIYYDFIYNDYETYYCRPHTPPLAPSKKERPNKADKDQKWAFTLTQPPDYVWKKPIEEVARLIMLHGITNKPYENAVEWAFVKEHTDKGTPHIHGVYKTPSGRRIAGKYFKRYWPLWEEPTDKQKKETTLPYHGHKGGYHALIRHAASYDGYMEKEGDVYRSAPVATLAPQDASGSDVDVIQHINEAEDFPATMIFTDEATVTLAEWKKLSEASKKAYGMALYKSRCKHGIECVGCEACEWDKYGDSYR